jgi:hypothetical protein
MSNAMENRMRQTLKEQTSEKFLRTMSLPRIPHQNTQPVIVRLLAGTTTYVAKNETHDKQANNGYSRNSLGGFFAHWIKKPLTALHS